MEERMTGAELAALRHLLGLTLDGLADALGVNPRTTRAWESGRDPIPARIAGEMGALVDEHGDLAQRMLDAGVPVVLRRGDRWALGAAARAVAVEPGLMLEWG